MSVIMTLRVQGDPKKLEQLADEDPQRIRSIADRAEEHGLIAHRFYGSEDGEILVVDEWPDADSFQRFYESEQSAIEPIFAAAATGEPQITFWRKLETHDDVGWEG
jgi:quinol monooxygenase YgiN